MAKSLSTFLSEQCQGLQGSQGSQGLQGTQGTQGLQGLQGTSGLDYAQGNQATYGKNRKGLSMLAWLTPG